MSRVGNDIGLILILIKCSVFCRSQTSLSSDSSHFEFSSSRSTGSLSGTVSSRSEESKAALNSVSSSEHAAGSGSIVTVSTTDTDSATKDPVCHGQGFEFEPLQRSNCLFFDQWPVSTSCK